MRHCVASRGRGGARLRGVPVDRNGSGFVFLWHVKLVLLLETRACVAMEQGLEGRPMLGELLRDTLLGRDDGLRGLLGLRVWDQ